MMTLKYLIEEFIAIVDYLCQQDSSFQKKGYLYVDKKIVIKLLNRNGYLKAEEKLNVWRDLRWIETETGHLTCRVSIGGRRVRRVQIDLNVFETLKKWYQNG